MYSKILFAILALASVQILDKYREVMSAKFQFDAQTLKDFAVICLAHALKW
jgi:hypothetical protein